MYTNIHWAMEDETARGDAAAAAGGNQSFCDAADLLLEGLTPPKAATLEQDYWRLDGSFTVFPDNPQDTAWGLWGAGLSDGAGTLAQPLTVTLAFGGTHTTGGLTLLFSPYEDNYPKSLTIGWYAGETLLREKVYVPTGWRLVAEEAVDSFDKLKITVSGLKRGGRYARLEGILFGKEVHFGPEELVSVEIVEETDPTGDSLPAGTLDFTVYSQEDAFNILEPTGLYAMLQQRQALTVGGEMNGIYRPLGVFYLEDWSQNGEHQFRMQGVDAVGVMEDTLFPGGVYTNVTGAALIGEILGDAGFGYSLDAELAAATVSGWLPRCSHREALRQAVFALGGAVDGSRSGSLRIYALPSARVGTIPMSRKVAGETDISLDTLVTGVAVTGHDYAPGESKQLYQRELTAGEQEITFSQPVSVTSVSGATLLYTHVNFIRVNVAEAGTVTVTGTVYEDNTTVATATWTGDVGGKENILEVTDATLVSGTAAASAAQRLLECRQRRLRQEMTLLLGEESLGNRYGVETGAGSYRDGLAESLTLRLTEGLSKAVIVG